jgi:hypothetical protein
MHRRAFLILLAVAGLVGCSRTFTSEIAFQAPAGWVYAPVLGHGAIWARGRGSREMIMAQTADTPLPLRRGRDWKDISICGDHAAILMSQRNNDEMWEGVSTSWGSKRYMAIYVRPMKVPRDPQAEVAIRSLCLKK